MDRESHKAEECREIEPDDDGSVFEDVDTDRELDNDPEYAVWSAWVASQDLPF